MIFLISSNTDESSNRGDSMGNHATAVNPVPHAGGDSKSGAYQHVRVGLRGLTLTELLIALGIVGVLAAVAIPMYADHTEKVKVGQAVQDITQIQTMIGLYEIDSRQLPDTLADVKMDGMLDPWKGPYQYTRLDNAKGKDSARKDKNLVPINTDYDLWSNGKDGKSVAPLTATASRDDIVRANNGRFVGPAADY